MYMGKYRTITNQQKHPKRSRNPEKKHIHRIARLPKSLWFSHTWVVTKFTEIRTSTTTTFISSWKPYKILECNRIITWHKWIWNYWNYQLFKWYFSGWYSISFTLCIMFKPSSIFITKNERLFIWQK